MRKNAYIYKVDWNITFSFKDEEKETQEVTQLMTGESRIWTQGMWLHMQLITALIGPASDWIFQLELIQPKVIR